MVSRLSLPLALGLLAILPACGGGGGGGSSATSSSSTGTTTGGSTGTTPQAQLAPTRAKTAVVIDREGEGFLEQDGGQLLLHVKGADFERGRQYGALVGDKIEQVVNLLPAFVASQNFPAWMTPGVSAIAASIFRSQFPQSVRDMISGIIAGNRQRRPSSFLIDDDVIFLTSLCDLGGITDGIVNCSSIAVWGPRTVGGKMFQTRNIDLMTGSGLETVTLCCIEKGAGKVPFINLGWTGMMGAPSGLNAHGIGIGQIWGKAHDVAAGRPWVLTTRRIMEEGINSDDAVTFFKQEAQRTYGSNFVFGDKGDGRGGQPGAWAIESTANHLAWFKDNDPNEDKAICQTPAGPVCYAVKLQNAVFRADEAMDPIIRSLQFCSDGPTGDPRGAGSYTNRYKGQSDSLLRRTQNGALMDAQGMIGITQDVAMQNQSLQCCVYANTDLEVWVANATLPNGPGHAAIDAYTAPYVHHDFNYYLPTVHATLDKSSYVAGEQQQVTLTWETLGCDRDLEVMLTLEGNAGGAMPYAGAPGPIAVSFRTGYGPQTKAQTVNVPAGMPAGHYQLAARLYERGTADLVDVSLAAFDVQ